MATLKELMGDKVRGDGRKFYRACWKEPRRYFEPIFDSGTFWYGLEDECANCYDPTNVTDWQEWHPPKKTKKVKLYKPILKSRIQDGEYYASIDHSWNTRKSNFRVDDIVGWMEMDAEVCED